MSSERKQRKSRRFSLNTMLQRTYMTFLFFFSNDLFAYASACAFGFLFSFIPVIMLILVILIRVLHTTPETIYPLFGNNEAVVTFLNLESVTSSIQQITTITNFEIVLGIAIIWMARRFFSSVMGGISCVFRTETPVRPLLSQLIVLAVEAVLIVATSAIIFLIITFNALWNSSFLGEFEKMFPRLTGSFTELIVKTLPYFIIFMVATVFYREGSRAKAKLSICILASALCTITFILFQKLMGIFINLNNYNFVYGVLSNTIVLLMEVFFFFVIFLFFAEFVFVHQYFDTLLISELYLLPDRNNTSLWATFKRLLFLKPRALMRKAGNSISLKKGETIYKEGDKGNCTFYIASGTVKISRPNNVVFFNSGSFFGEEACILDQQRKENATAQTDVKLVRISEEVFYSLLEKNPKVSAKAMSRISKYFARFYRANEGHE
ncbi:MAG TPA: hypothetical protein DCM57_05685 [Treponema sp.]|nr:hypothetical protein [Treponema sp.]HBB43064.1 hypothetical protein [Treponema sp.]